MNYVNIELWASLNVSFRKDNDGRININYSTGDGDGCLFKTSIKELVDDLVDGFCNPETKLIEGAEEVEVANKFIAALEESAKELRLSIKNPLAISD